MFSSPGAAILWTAARIANSGLIRFFLTCAGYSFRIISQSDLSNLTESHANSSPTSNVGPAKRTRFFLCSPKGARLLETMNEVEIAYSAYCKRSQLARFSVSNFLMHFTNRTCVQTDNYLYGDMLGGMFVFM